MELFFRFLWFAKTCIKGCKRIAKIDQNWSDRKSGSQNKLPQYFNYFQLCRKVTKDCTSEMAFSTGLNCFTENGIFGLSILDKCGVLITRERASLKTTDCYFIAQCWRSYRISCRPGTLNFCHSLKFRVFASCEVWLLDCFAFVMLQQFWTHSRAGVSFVLKLPKKKIILVCAFHHPNQPLILKFEPHKYSFML